ncbi:MAG: tetratricopeptide repeat protein [Candidatus Aminicenantes bacterium]|nr:tetratricopeptide repeat protein [Candidatus Aminicenantes bacterium]
MSRIRASRLFIGLFAAAIVVASVACDKLNVKYLSGNHHFNRGNTLFNEKKYTKAIEEYELAVQNNPDLKEAYRYIGESYKAIFQPGKESEENKVRGDKALEALRKAYEIDPDNKDIIYSLADMYDKLRDIENAEQLFLRIIELEPGNMNNYYIAAEFYKRYAGENEDLKRKAEQMYLRRIETDPDAVQGYAYMANYYDNLPVGDFKDKFDRALEYHIKRQKIEPENAELYYTIGVNRFNKAYQLQNFLSESQREAAGSEAEQALLKAIEIDPNFANSFAYMKMLYINVHSKLYPERESRYLAEADRYGEKFTEAQKRAIERMKLEKELKK